MVQLYAPAATASSSQPSAYGSRYPAAGAPPTAGSGPRSPSPTLPPSIGLSVPAPAHVGEALLTPQAARGGAALPPIEAASIERRSPALSESTGSAARDEAAARLQDHARHLQDLSRQLAAYARSEQALQGLWIEDTLDEIYAEVLAHHHALVAACSGRGPDVALSDAQRAAGRKLASTMRLVQAAVHAQRDLKTYGYLFHELVHCCAPWASNPVPGVSRHLPS